MVKTDSKNLNKLSNLYIDYSFDGVGLFSIPGEDEFSSDTKLKNVKSFMAFCEFLYFFLHLSNRVIFSKKSENDGNLFQKLLRS